MLTLAIQIEAEGSLLILKDSAWGVAETCSFRDPFLKGMVLDAEFRLEQRNCAADS